MSIDIYHIADIHIKDGIHSEIEYAFDKLIEAINKNTVEKSILVIVGDIFDRKTFCTQYDVKCFNNCMYKLDQSKIETIIIPGNHDYNNQGELDLLTPLLTMNNMNVFSNIYCYPKSGVYTHKGIEFHIYSPIDQEIPEFGTPNKNVLKIALVHEPIRGATLYGSNIVTNARLGKEELLRYNAALLGDLHKSHFIVPNRIGYCGSLVQINKGESLIHGYLKWNFANQKKPIAEFVQIPLRKGYIKLNVENDNDSYTLHDIDAIKIQFDYKNCTNEFIKDQVSKLQDKYGSDVEINMRNRTPKIQDDSTEDQIIIAGEPTNRDDFNLDTIENQMNIIELYMKRENMDSQLIESVKNKHRLEASIPEPYKSFELLYMEWENISCYGTDNFINFDELKGIVSITGNNRSGKSSLISTILLALSDNFGKISSIKKDEISNKNFQNPARVKLSFKVDSDIYLISYNLSSKADSYMYKNNELFQSSKTSTRSFMKSLIGTEKNLTMVPIRIQDTKSIADSGDLMLIKNFEALLHLDVLESIRKKVKKEYDLKSKKLDTLKKNVGRPISTLIEKQKIASNQIIESMSIIKKITSAIQQTSSTKDELLSNIDKEYESITLDQLNNKLTMYEQIIEKLVCPKIKDLKNLKKLQINTKNEIAKAKDEIILRLKQRVNPPTFKDVPVTTQTKEEMIDLISILEKKVHYRLERRTNYNMNVLDVKIDAFLNSHPKLAKMSLDTLNAKLVKTAETDIINIDEYIEQLDEIPRLKDELVELNNIYDDTLQNQVDQLKTRIRQLRKTYESITYEKGCECCKNNKDKIKMISGEKQMLIDLKELKNKLLISNDAYERLDELNELLPKLIEAKTINEQNQIIKRNNRYKERIELLSDYLDCVNDKNQIESEQASKKINILKIQLEMLEYTAVKLNNDVIDIEIKDLEESVIKFKLKLGKITDQIQYLECDEKIEKLKKNIDARKKLTHTTQKLSSMNELLTSQNRELVISETDQFKLQKVIDSRKLKDQEIEELEIEVNEVETYYNMLQPNNLPFTILKQNVDKYVDEINMILCDVADFQIDIEVDEIEINKEKDGKSKKSTRKIIKFKINEFSGTGENAKRTIPSTLASGYQKFILDVAFRLACIKLIPSSPKFLIIDEGFGALDAENRELARNVIQSIAIDHSIDLKFILIVSHMDEFQGLSNEYIRVERVKSDLDENIIISRTQFGERQSIGGKEYTPKPNQVTTEQVEQSEQSEQSEQTETSKFQERNYIIDIELKQQKCLICDKQATWNPSSTKRSSTKTSHFKTKMHKKNLQKKLEELSDDE
jgi:DNA repair exonuclease SbcCD ATPase subunit